MSSRARASAARGGLAVTVAIGMLIGGGMSATAVDIAEGDRPVVISVDQSTFAVVPDLPPLDDATLFAEVSVDLFGGPDPAEITPWAATALSFDSVDRLYVVLLSAAAGGGEFACAIRLYDEAGLPVGSALPVNNPDDADFGFWSSSCEALALLDIVTAFGFDVDTGSWDVPDPRPTRTDAVVYFSDSSSTVINARTGIVNSDSTLASGGGFADGVSAVAFSAGPASLVEPGRTGRAFAVVLFTVDGFFVNVLFENYDDLAIISPGAESQALAAEFDSEMNLWFTFPTNDSEPPATAALSLTLSDLIASVSEDPSASDRIISAGTLIAVIGDSRTELSAGGIAIERDAVQPESDEAGEAPAAELADTGARADIVLLLFAIAIAIALGGAGALAVARRRSTVAQIPLR